MKTKKRYVYILEEDIKWEQSRFIGAFTTYKKAEKVKNKQYADINAPFYRDLSIRKEVIQ